MLEEGGSNAPLADPRPLRRLAVVLVALIAGGVLSVATLWVPAEVASKEGMARVELGLPMPFVTQDRSREDPPDFPRRYYLGMPQEFPTHVDVHWLLLDSILFGGGVLSGLTFVRRLRRRPTSK